MTIPPKAVSWARKAVAGLISVKRRFECRPYEGGAGKPHGGRQSVRACFLVTIVTAAIIAVIAAACGSNDTPGPRAESTSTATLGGVLDRSGIAVPGRGRFVLVNIPAFELIAIEDGRPVLHSRVIVGTPATPTPELLSSLYSV